MVRGAEKGKAKIISMLQQKIGYGAQTDFAVAHVDAAATGEWFKQQIEMQFAPQREVFVLDASPALALHTGFGTAAVAYIEP